MIGDPAQYERFQRELEAMRTLQHPALQRGIESGKYNNTPFLVTEMIDGQSLRELIRTSAPFTADRSLAITRKIADAMAMAATPVSFNLTGNIYMNQNAAFSDFHVTGGNPAGNASFTNPEYVTKRFTWVGHREPVKR